MAHHRCTACKKESYPRHKHLGGVYCDACIHWIRGERFIRRSWFSSIWDSLLTFATSIFQPESPKRVERARERVFHARLKAMQAKARSLPFQPMTPH